ncbi:hypothetical protein ZIOFF_066769 [Zingiber officinale]|uniref:Plant disease resistance WDH domain-containing protein n=1 Tax=Zingiber officinale TaxID=94328 RepID=A0A8J5EYT7_ZINOF|nr:hypothetical protein ZIOFF_066769 [Zingiber officinale]
MHENWPGRYRSRPSSFSKGVACVHGPTGIGKTELWLEFAYQVSQSYKMVLWVGETMMLMKGKNTKLTIEDVNALRIIEENLGRNPLGLSIVRALLSELSMDPHALLVSITQMSYRERVWNKKEDLVLKHNPVLVQLLDLCFNILEDVNNPGRLATRMVEMNNWFAPSMIPISMLRIAASTLPVKHRHEFLEYMSSGYSLHDDRRIIC